MKTKRKENTVLCCRLTTVSALSGEKIATIADVKQRPLLNIALKLLRKHCPPALPVTVQIKLLAPHTLGQCARQARRFVISLNAAMGQDQAIDTLLHEWSHALSWHLVLDKLSKVSACAQEHFEEVSHDETWGCAYSRVYRISARYILPALNKADADMAAEKSETARRIREWLAKQPPEAMPEYGEIPPDVAASIKAKST